MKTRVNKSNRPILEAYVIERFNYKSQHRKDRKKNYLSIADIWDVEFELQDKFNVSDPASQKIAWDIAIEHSGNRLCQPIV